ncbi:hypothetical protein, partial [Solemya elarraichensis gill symbiont]
ELVGIYILHKINKLFANEVGLYRDDGLGILRSHTPSQAERVSKNLISIFKDLGLRITIEHSLKIVNFLDVNLNLKNNTYRPYAKPNNITQYVHVNSNHPQSVIKAIAPSINRRLSNISSNEDQFNNASQDYQEALNKAGYNYTLKFEPKQKSENRRKRTRNIIWFNPPFSKQVCTSVGKKFLQLIDKHFPIDNKLHKVFNRNNVKVSYSCMKNMGAIINTHNKSILQKDNKPKIRECNCRQTNECPLAGKCLQKSIIYQANVITAQESKAYIGISDTEFKKRWYNHQSSFRLEHKKKDTELSKYIWNLKEKRVDYTIEWTVLKQTCSYSNTTKKCLLCIWEKYYIITADKTKILNSRTELISKCRHANKFLVCNV